MGTTSLGILDGLGRLVSLRSRTDLAPVAFPGAPCSGTFAAAPRTSVTGFTLGEMPGTYVAPGAHYPNLTQSTRSAVDTADTADTTDTVDT